MSVNENNTEISEDIGVGSLFKPCSDIDYFYSGLLLC